MPAGVNGTDAQLWTVSYAIDHMDELDAVDAIVFGHPTCMGNKSAEQRLSGKEAFLGCLGGKSVHAIPAE